MSTIRVIKKLPDAEFDIMKVVWGNRPPITTKIIMQQLGGKRKWKAQTVISLMSRLEKRGFLRTEKNGKELNYFPLISKEDYLKFETNDFMERFYANSFVSLVNTLYAGNKLKDSDLEQLAKWLNDKRN